MNDVERAHSSLDVEAARHEFDLVNQLAGNIADQNNRYDRVDGEISDSDFQALAREGLEIEQRDLMDRLKTAAHEGPFRELGERHVVVTELLGASAIELASKYEEIAAASQEIELTADATVNLAPLITEKARELSERKKQEYVEQSGLSSIEEQVARLEAEHAELNSLYESISEPWAIPFAAAHGESEIHEVQIRDGEGQRTSLGEIHRDAPEAAKHIVEYLLSHPDVTTRVDQLIDHVYSPEVIETTSKPKLRNRITTTLGPKVHGPIIEAILQENGHTLQYGGEVIRTQSPGKRVRGAKYRVYRLVPTDSFSESHLEKQNGIQWEVTENQMAMIWINNKAGGTSGADSSPERREGQKKQRYEEVIDILVGNVSQKLTYEELIRRIYPDETVINQNSRTRIAVIFNRHAEQIESALKALGLRLQKQKVSEEGKVKKVLVVSAEPLEGYSGKTPGPDIDKQNGSMGTEESKETDILPKTEPSPRASQNGRAAKREVKPAPSSSNGGVKQERPPAQPWEGMFKGKVAEVLARLHTAGAIDSPDGVTGKAVTYPVPVKNPSILKALRDKGIISPEEFTSENLGITSAVAALLLTGEGTKKLIMSKTSRPHAIRIINESTNGYLASVGA